MAKLKLEICCGTTCFMLGGDKLLKIEQYMPEEWRDLVEVSACPCMNECVAQELCAAPFVRLDGEILRHANAEVVLEELRRRLAGAAGK